jgi:hypothetical protein
MKKPYSNLLVNLKYYFNDFFKKSLILLCLVFFSFYSGGQSIELGLKGALGSTLLLNGNVLSGKDNEGYGFALSNDYGLHGAFNFAHGYGLELEILKANIEQGYGGVFGGSGEFPGDGITYFQGESYSAVTQISVIQIPMLFRYEHDITGKYLEAGLGYEIIESGTYSATYRNPGQLIDQSISNQLPKGNFMAIVGLGWDKRMGHESNLYFNFGFRLEYGLFDMMGVDGHGQDISGPKSVILYEQPDPFYKEYHGTHSLELTINVGLSYRIYPRAMMRKRVIDF